MAPIQADKDNRSEAMKGKLMGLTGDLMLVTSLRLGSDLGLFKLLNDTPMTTEELATKAGISKRYAFEWCLHMAANKILDHNPQGDTFRLPKEHAEHIDVEEGMVHMLLCLSDNHSKQYPMTKLAYQTDGGIFWGDMHSVPRGAKLFFKPVYEQLLPLWLEGLPALKKHFEAVGASVVDIGCGCGISTIAMADIFPNTKFVGLDYHGPSIEECKALAQQKGTSNVTFEVHDANSWVKDDKAESKYEVVCMFDCYHDMSGPEQIAKEVLHALKPGGVWFLIEPLSSEGDSIAEKLAMPTSPVYGGFSAHYCTPCGKAVHGKEGLGTTAGTIRYKTIVMDAGFSQFENIGAALEGPTSPTMMGFRLLLVTK